MVKEQSFKNIFLELYEVSVQKKLKTSFITIIPMIIVVIINMKITYLNLF